jgi:hypothetical protein
MVFNSNIDDYTIGEFNVYYLPHPALYGDWEIFKGDGSEFVGRAQTKQEVKKLILEYENI